MDNITQGVIGGALFSLISKKPTTKKFILGAAIANIPDLDVFIAQFVSSNSIDQFFFHRGIMHGIIFVTVISLVLGYILSKTDTRTSYRRYVIACWVSMIFGHLLIDGMTSYGMRYFLPRNNTSYSTDNMFIIDLGMWLITITGAVRYVCTTHKKRIASRILGTVGIYIASSFGLQWYAHTVFQKNHPLSMPGITIQQARTLASPLQIFLRKHLVQTSHGVYEWRYSVFDPTTTITRKWIPTDITGQAFIENLRTTNKDIDAILGFARDMYIIEPLSGGYMIKNRVLGSIDGRRSTTSDSTFTFWIGTGEGEQKVIQSYGAGRFSSIDSELLLDFWRRIRGNPQTIQ